MVPATVLSTSQTNGSQSHDNCVQGTMHVLVKELEAIAEFLMIKVPRDLLL